MACIKFVGKISCYSSCQGNLPHLQTQLTCYGKNTVMSFLKTKVNLDKIMMNKVSNISLLILSESIKTFVQEKLHQVRSYIFWDDENSFEQIYNLETEKLSVLLKHYLFYSELLKQKNAMKLIDIKTKAEVIRIISEVLILLVDQISYKNHIFGFVNPTTLDATIGAELILLFSSPHCSFYLNKVNHKVISLKRFVTRLKSKYLFIKMEKDAINVNHELRFINSKIALKVEGKNEKNKEESRSWVFFLNSFTLLAILYGLNYKKNLKEQ